MQSEKENSESHKDLKAKEALGIIRWAYSLLYKLEPKLTVVTTLTAIIRGIQGIGMTYIITRIMDMLVKSVQDPQAQISDIFPYLGTLLFFNIIVSILGYFDFTSNREFSTKIDYKTEIILAEQLTKLGISVLEDPDVNNKIFRARSSIHTLENYYKQSIRVLVYLIGFIVSLGIILFYIPIMVPIVLITSLPEYLIDKKFRKDIWSMYLDNTEKRRLAGENINQLTVTKSLPEIYVNGAYNFLLKKFVDVSEWFTEKIVRIYKIWSLTARSAGIISDLGTYTGYVLIFKNLISGVTSVGSMFFQIRMIQSTQSYLSNLTSQINNVMEISVRIQEVYDIFQMKGQISNGSVPLPRLREGPKIEIKDLTFSYPSKDKEVLKNLNLTINAGEKIAIVGENGSGKTTLVKLLCKMYSPTRGSIRINDLPLEDLRINDWYKNLGVMFQEYNTYPQLSVKENITIGRSIEGKNLLETTQKEAKLREAAEGSNVLDNIMEFPNCWDQLLSEKYKGGIRPSTGQWQKIAISRFFYRDASTVIFDEPTASIDAVSEYNIFNRIYSFFEKKTVIIISHRFGTVRNADRIFVLKDGEIKEQGTHLELMQIDDGIYKTSFELQKKGYE